MQVTRWMVALLTLGIALTAMGQEVVVRHRGAPGVPLLRAVTHTELPSSGPDNLVCLLADGDRATVLEAVAIESSSTVWLRVQVASGTCVGGVGWLRAEHAQTN